MKDWLLTFCLAVIALFAYHEWSAKNSPAPEIATATPAPLVMREPSDPPAQTPAAAPSLSVALPAPTAPPDVDLATKVAESRKLALAKYPDLGVAGSPINQRFVSRYQQLAAFQSPLLRDPSWPMRLADECAAAAPAANARPATALAVAPAPPAPAAVVSRVRAASVPVHDPLQAAATPAPANEAEPLIALDVRSMNAGGTFLVNWLTDYGSYDVSGRANKALDLDAKNLSAHASKVTLQWIFTARGPTRGKRYIFDMGSSDWDMKPNQAVHFGVRSADLTHRSIWYAGLGQGYYSGSEIEGWIVAARFHDKILKSVGSSATLEDMIGTDDFKGMVLAYQKVGTAHNGSSSMVTNAPWW